MPVRYTKAPHENSMGKCNLERYKSSLRQIEICQEEANATSSLLGKNLLQTSDSPNVHPLPGGFKEIIKFLKVTQQTTVLNFRLLPLKLISLYVCFTGGNARAMAWHTERGQRATWGSCLPLLGSRD